MVWCGAVQCGVVQRGRVGRDGAGKDRKRERERGTARTACVVAAAAIAGVEAAADTGSAAGVEAVRPDRCVACADATRGAVRCDTVSVGLCCAVQCVRRCGALFEIGSMNDGSAWRVSTWQSG